MARFGGGVHPAGCKQYSKDEAIGRLPDPKEVWVPLSQHIGAPAIPAVQAGERVLRGQLIGRAAEGLSANVFSPVAGTVKGIVTHITFAGKKAEHVLIENDFTDESVTLPPLAERTPFRILQSLAKKGGIRFYFAKEGGSVLAYTVLHFFRGYTQVLYLAVMPEGRGRGTGSKLIPLIKEKAGGTLILEVEDPACAETQEELVTRERRIAFYRRLGFEMLPGCRLLIPGGVLRPMSDGEVKGDLPELWRSMYRELAGAFFGMFIRTDGK